jgi:hypothetical protein
VTANRCNDVCSHGIYGVNPWAMEPTAPATPRRVKASAIAWNQNITAPTWHAVGQWKLVICHLS